MDRLRQQTKPFSKNIFCGIDVSVMLSTTDGACPFPNRKVFRPDPFCPAVITKLAGREETVYGYDLLAIPRRFVGELSAEFAPAYVEYGFGEFMVFSHILGG